MKKLCENALWASYIHTYILPLSIRYILSYKSCPPSMHNDVQRRSVTHQCKGTPISLKKEPAPPLHWSVHIAHQGAVLPVTFHHMNPGEVSACCRIKQKTMWEVSSTHPVDTVTKTLLLWHTRSHGRSWGPEAEKHTKTVPQVGIVTLNENVTLTSFKIHYRTLILSLKLSLIAFLVIILFFMWSVFECLKNTYYYYY